jgi:hypothetical protein
MSVMKNWARLTMRRRSLAGVCLLLAGGVGGPYLLLAAEPASAVSCGAAEPAGTPCTLTGTVGLTGGSLTLTAPSSLTWAATLNGQDQQLVDATTGDTQYGVNDATGSGAGWHVTASATTFTSGSLTLANAGTLSTNGSTSSVSSTTVPGSQCNTSGGANTCVLSASTASYPVAITTAASTPTAFTIYDDSANAGMGSITVGTSAHPVGWWVSVPSSAAAGTYTSTITMAIVSGP